MGMKDGYLVCCFLTSSQNSTWSPYGFCAVLNTFWRLDYLTIEFSQYVTVGFFFFYKGPACYHPGWGGGGSRFQSLFDNSACAPLDALRVVPLRVTSRWWWSFLALSGPVALSVVYYEILWRRRLCCCQLSYYFQRLCCYQLSCCQLSCCYPGSYWWQSCRGRACAPPPLPEVAVSLFAITVCLLLFCLTPLLLWSKKLICELLNFLSLKHFSQWPVSVFKRGKRSLRKPKHRWVDSF
jgi:hypothetical protein